MTDRRALGERLREEAKEAMRRYAFISDASLRMWLIGVSHVLDEAAAALRSAPAEPPHNAMECPYCTTDQAAALEDLRRIGEALGIYAGAKPYPAHEYVERDVLPAIARLRRAEPPARRELTDEEMAFLFNKGQPIVTSWLPLDTSGLQAEPPATPAGLPLTAPLGACPNCHSPKKERIAGLWLCQKCGHEWDDALREAASRRSAPQGEFEKTFANVSAWLKSHGYEPPMRAQPTGEPPTCGTWQPIETAPKANARPVLLWWPFASDDTPIIGWWDGVSWRNEVTIPDLDGDPGPTQWMPLPAPPSPPEKD